MTNTLKLLTFVACVLSLTAQVRAQATIKLLASKSPPRAEIVVTDCSPEFLHKLTQTQSPQLNQHLQVFVRAAAEKGDAPAVLGSVLIKDKILCFEPKYPLEAGVEYLVRYREAQDGQWQNQVVGLPKKQLESSTLVKEVYPTSNQLPQNLLKFYVYFTAPMTQGEAYEHIELQNANGQRVPFPFLEIAEELWDRSGQRLTLLLDPARVKRGLVPREEDGPILNAGSRYRLVIKSTWPDARGAPLTKGFAKTFTVIAEDFRQPDPATWKIKSPKSKTQDVLTFIMPEPMDHATFARGVTIENAKGQTVLGEFTFSHGETQAHFTPLKDWRPGLYDVRILKHIEDLVGNSIQRPFEVDRFDNIATAPNERESITIEIE